MAGIPIKVHVTLLFLLPMLALQMGSQVLLGLTLVVLVFGCIALHELGHSMACIRCGLHVQEILLLPIGGMAKVSGMDLKPRDEILVAAAGPLVNLLLFPLFMLGYRLCAATEFLFGASLMYNLAFINMILALFNLIPSFPMDGGRIFRALMTPRLGRIKATQLAAGVGKTIAVGFFLLGLLYLHLVMMLMAVFVFLAADQELQSVLIQEAGRRNPVMGAFFAAREPPQAVQQPMRNEISVGPPPYARKKKARLFLRNLMSARNSLFEELGKWDY